MNDMQVFKNERFKHMPLEIQLQYIGAIALMLGVSMDWAEENYSDTAFEIANEALDFAVAVECEWLYSLVHAVKWYATSRSMKDEAYFNLLFNLHADKIIPGGLVIRKSPTAHDRPDSWIRLNGEDIPVEIKIHCFNDKALKQLTRYMTVFKANRGIAVGKSLSVELSSNISFIGLDELEKFDTSHLFDEETARKSREDFISLLKEFECFKTNNGGSDMK